MEYPRWPGDETSSMFPGCSLLWVGIGRLGERSRLFFDMQDLQERPALLPQALQSHPRRVSLFAVAAVLRLNDR
jgi:hypothetical protein